MVLATPNDPACEPGFLLPLSQKEHQRPTQRPKVQFWLRVSGFDAGILPRCGRRWARIHKRNRFTRPNPLRSRIFLKDNLFHDGGHRLNDRGYHLPGEPIPIHHYATAQRPLQVILSPAVTESVEQTVAFPFSCPNFVSFRRTIWLDLGFSRARMRQGIHRSGKYRTGAASLGATESGRSRGGLEECDGYFTGRLWKPVQARVLLPGSPLKRRFRCGGFRKWSSGSLAAHKDGRSRFQFTSGSRLALTEVTLERSHPEQLGVAGKSRWLRLRESSVRGTAAGRRNTRSFLIASVSAIDLLTSLKVEG